MGGRSDQKPALTGLRVGHFLGVDGVLHRIARRIIDGDVIARHPKIFKKARRKSGFRCTLENEIGVATGKHDACRRVAPIKSDGCDQAVGRRIERYLVAQKRNVRVDDAAEHDDPGGRPARRIPRREAVFQRHQQHRAERRQARDQQQQHAGNGEPPTKLGETASPQQHAEYDEQQDEIGWNSKAAEGFGQIEVHRNMMVRQGDLTGTERCTSFRSALQTPRSIVQNGIA
jgi:hypothetical protein